MKINNNREIIDRVLDYSLSMGMEKAEVFIINTKNMTAEAKDRKIEAFESSNSSVLSVRILNGKRPGFSYTTDLDIWQKAIDDAIASSKWTQEDEFIDFPVSNQYQLPDIYDKDIVTANENNISEMAIEIENTALSADNRVKKVRKASSSISLNKITIANTNGLNAYYESTSCSIHVMAVAEYSGESQIGWDYEGSRFLSRVSPERVGKGATRRALRLIGSQKTNSLKTSIVLENSVSNDFLGIFASALSSENTQKGKSLLINKKGRKVISDKINIIDNATLNGELGSRPFDTEGFPSKRNVLIREGILNGYLHNTYTANKDGTESTGNAVRHGISGVVGVGISNLFIEPVSQKNVHSLDELFSIVNNGLFITEAMGIHTANPISGEFSIGVNGLLIEGGRVSFPVKEAVISGNLLDLFLKIESLGDDLKFYGKLGSPSLLIRDIDISA